MKKFIRYITLVVTIVLLDCMFVFAANENIGTSENSIADEKENCVGVNGKERPDFETEQIQMLTISGQWIQSANGRWWYKHNDNTYTKNGWELINGQWYYFDSEGWMVTGWIKVGIDWYYLSGSGAMVTGWQTINGKWYYFNGNGVMMTGWILLRGKWYYLDTSGVMQTGWLSLNGKWYCLKSDGAMVIGWYKTTYLGQYGGKAYWNYFDSNGAYVTDSDVKGCIHGKNTYVDHKCINSGKLGYCISTTKKSKDSIKTAASYWNDLKNCHASFTQSGTSYINITSSKTFDATTLAMTYFFYNGNKTKPENTNWSGCQIDLNENKSTTIATIAHEFGHTLGLTHRISKKDSIMCQKGQGRTATKPNTTEISVVNHLY